MEPMWEDKAKLMLDRRDRFTRPQVADEFRQYSLDLDRLKDQSIPFDEENDGYVTPVLRDRYSVVWYLRNGEQPVVHAVVPTARFTRGAEDLKSRLEQIVSKASDNLVTLK
jgi:hypothetical protein